MVVSLRAREEVESRPGERLGAPGKTYYQRRIAEGDSRHRALRCLKRRIARVVYNRLKGSCRPGRRLPPVFMLPLADLEPGRERRNVGGANLNVFVVDR